MTDEEARAIRILRDSDKPEASSGNFGRAYLALGRALKGQGKQTEARAAFRTSAEHLRNAFGPDHPDTWSAYELGNADTDRGPWKSVDKAILGMVSESLGRKRK